MSREGGWLALTLVVKRLHTFFVSRWLPLSLGMFFISTSADTSAAANYASHFEEMINTNKICCSRKKIQQECTLLSVNVSHGVAAAVRCASPKNIHLWTSKTNKKYIKANKTEFFLALYGRAERDRDQLQTWWITEIIIKFFQRAENPLSTTFSFRYTFFFRQSELTVVRARSSWENLIKLNHNGS